MKIPDQAKRVFQGVIFDIYQWPQKMFDGTEKTFELAKRKNSVEILVIQDNQVLFACEEQPAKGKFYTMFGGKVEDNETILEGAKRELLEEAGLASDDWELLRTYNTTPKVDWELTIFIARNAYQAVEQHLDGGEKISTEKKSFEDFIDLLTTPNFHINPHLIVELLQMKYTAPEKLIEFKKKLGLT